MENHLTSRLVLTRNLLGPQADHDPIVNLQKHFSALEGPVGPPFLSPLHAGTHSRRSG